MVHASAITAWREIINVAMTYNIPITNKGPSLGNVKILYFSVTFKLFLMSIKLTIKKNKVGNKKNNILYIVFG